MFDLAAIDKPPGPVDRLGIIGAQQRLEPYKMPIKPDRINPVSPSTAVPTAECFSFKGTTALTDLLQCLPGTGLRETHTMGKRRFFESRAGSTRLT